jgi:hypothetical protein
MKILDNFALVGDGSRFQHSIQELAPQGMIVNRLIVRALLRGGLWFQRACRDEIIVNVWEAAAVDGIVHGFAHDGRSCGIAASHRRVGEQKGSVGKGTRDALAYRRDHWCV